MGQNTKIAWCHSTMNFWVGCEKISPACDSCYAESWAKRAGRPELWQGTRQRTTAENWKQPFKWNAAAKAAGERHRVFVNSLSDFFDNQVDEKWRHDAWNVISHCPDLDWLLLTKRPQNIRKMLPIGWLHGWPHVWIGTTVENQEEANRRIPNLLAVPAVVHFLSMEPLLEPVRLDRVRIHDGFVEVHGGRLPAIDWVIVGSESGSRRARVCELDWVRDIRDQCITSGTAFFWKQHAVNGRKIGTPALDGRQWLEYPRTTALQSVS